MAKDAKIAKMVSCIDVMATNYVIFVCAKHQAVVPSNPLFIWHGSAGHGMAGRGEAWGHFFEVAIFS